jgi:hypothetical protein
MSNITKRPAKKTAKAEEAEPKHAKPAPKPVAKPAPAPKPAPVKAAPARPARPPRVAFPKKNQQPTPAAFTACLPLQLGKRFEASRTFLLKLPNVTEDVYFYGPSTGWGLRYQHMGKPLCTLLLHGDQPVSILSLDPAANEGVDWQALSPVGQQARKSAHGSPSLLWLDVPLAGTGAADFKIILRAKLATLTATLG